MTLRTRRELVTPNSPSQLLLDPLGFGGGPRASQMNVRKWRQSNASSIRILAAPFNPSLDFGEIPDDAAGSQIKTAGELTALFHLVDGRVGERHQQSEFVRRIVRRAPFHTLGGAGPLRGYVSSNWRLAKSTAGSIRSARISSVSPNWLLGT